MRLLLIAEPGADKAAKDAGQAAMLCVQSLVPQRQPVRHYLPGKFNKLSRLLQLSIRNCQHLGRHTLSVAHLKASCNMPGTASVQ